MRGSDPSMSTPGNHEHALDRRRQSDHNRASSAQEHSMTRISTAIVSVSQLVEDAQSIFRGTTMRALPVVLAMLLIAPAARADWQYTHWGMTPEQVVAASKGTVKLLPEKERPRLPPTVTAATGAYQDGPLQLRVTFSFNIATNGLVCVNYGLNSHDGDEAFKASLVKRYGPPQKTSGVGFLGMTTLVWKTPTDQIEATFAKDDPAYVMQCSLKK
jgi:hypothetical protein